MRGRVRVRRPSVDLGQPEAEQRLLLVQRAWLGLGLGLGLGVGVGLGLGLGFCWRSAPSLPTSASSRRRSCCSC